VETLYWSPADHAAAEALAKSFGLSSFTPPYLLQEKYIRLSASDLCRLVMLPLIQAEQIAYLTFVNSNAPPGGGVIPSANFPGIPEMLPDPPGLPRFPGPNGGGAPAPFPRVVGRGGVVKDPLVWARFGPSAGWAYDAPQYLALRIVRGSQKVPVNEGTRAFDSHLPALTMGLGTHGDEPPAISGTVQTIGPAVLVLIGVLGCAALAAGAYVGSEYARSDAQVEMEKVRVHAELAMKQQVIAAQIAAGQVPALDQLWISQGKAEQTRFWGPWALLVGAAGLGAGVEIGRRWERRRRV